MDIKPAKPAIGKMDRMRIMMTAGNGASRKLANFSFDSISMSALVGMDIQKRRKTVPTILAASGILPPTVFLFIFRGGNRPCVKSLGMSKIVQRMAFHVKTWSAMRCKRRSYSTSSEYGAEILRPSGSAGGPPAYSKAVDGTG